MFNVAHIYTKEKQEARAEYEKALPQFLAKGKVKVIPFAKGSLSVDAFPDYNDERE